MTAPKRCKICGRSRKDLKGAKDIPVKHQCRLWESGTSIPGYGNNQYGDQHCWSCLRNKSTSVLASPLPNFQKAGSK